MTESMLGFLDKEERKEYLIALVVVLLFGAMTLKFVFDDQLSSGKLGMADKSIAHHSAKEGSDTTSTTAAIPSKEKDRELSTRLGFSAESMPERSELSTVSTKSLVAPEVSASRNSVTEQLASSEVSNAQISDMQTSEPSTDNNLSEKTAEVTVETAIETTVEIKADTTADTAPEIKAEKASGSVVEAVIETVVENESASVDANEQNQSRFEGIVGTNGNSADVEILFDEASADLDEESLVKLTSVALVLNKYPELKLRISGHADPVGNADENLRLSRRRALASREFLIESEVDPERLIIESHGETQASTDNQTEADLRRSRRVELRLEY